MTKFSVLKKELVTHCLVTLAWLVGVVILRVVFKPISFLTTSQLFSWFLFCFGALLGTMILDLDQVFYVLLIYPEERAKELWKQRKIKALLEYLAETHWERERLIFHNVLFQIFWLIFCFWVLTSTANSLGKGLVMGIGLHLLKDEIEFLVYGQKKELLKRLFWPIKREISFREQKLFVILMTIFFFALSLFLF